MSNFVVFVVTVDGRKHPVTVRKDTPLLPQLVRGPYHRPRMDYLCDGGRISPTATAQELEINAGGLLDALTFVRSART